VRDRAGSEDDGVEEAAPDLPPQPAEVSGGVVVNCDAQLDLDRQNAVVGALP